MGPIHTSIRVAHRAVAVVGVALLCAVFAPAVAWASSTYVVHACYSNGADVNNAFTNPPPTNGNIHTASNCDGNDGSGEGLQVWSAGSVDGSQAGGWWLNAPSGTSITGLIYGDAIFSAWGGWVAHWATSYDGSGDPVPVSDYADCQSTGCSTSSGAGSASPTRA
jgi:hypothetical protein